MRGTPPIPPEENVKLQTSQFSFSEKQTDENTQSVQLHFVFLFMQLLNPNVLHLAALVSEASSKR